MAEMPVRLGPPFGGITRIRFKGFVYDVSAIRLPRSLYIYTQNRTYAIDVNRADIRCQMSDVTGQRY
jgi:hypothetical protein